MNNIVAQFFSHKNVRGQLLKKTYLFKLVPTCPNSIHFSFSSQPGGMPIKQEMDIKSETDIKTEDSIKSEIKNEPMDSSEPGQNNSGPDIKPTIKQEIKPENKPVIERKPPVKVSFSPEELRTALMPPLMKMFDQEPEAGPFRIPVDPITLNIPDYFEIVKTPMDMSEIRRKLESGEYKDPWEYIDDVWLMFENAWVYNRKTSRVYKYCSKVL